MTSKTPMNFSSLNDIEDIDNELLEEIAYAVMATRRSPQRSQFLSDAVQDAMVKVLNKHRNETSDELPNRLQLIRMAQQRLFSIVRGEWREIKRRQKVAALTPEGEESRLNFPDSEVIDSMLDCVKKLKEQERDLINRRYLECKTETTPTYRQLAEEDQRSTEAISRMMARAYNDLRDCMNRKSAGT